MSTPQRTHARVTLVVDRTTADVLRLEAKKILMFGHEDFEDYLDLSPEVQHALAMRFRDATDLITSVGWVPDGTAAKARTFEVPVTADLITQLAHRRVDLAAFNRERLGDFDGQDIPADVMAEIAGTRDAATELDRVIAAYAVAIAGAA